MRAVTPGKLSLLAGTLLGLMAAQAHAGADGPAPPEGFRDRSGLSELVFWQGINGLFAGSFLGYAVAGGTIEDHCKTTYGPEEKYSETCKDALGRSGGITALGLAAGIGVPLLVTRGHDVRTGDALLVNRSTLVGVMHGYIVPFASGLDNDRGRDRRILSALAFTGDLAGIGVGTYLAQRHDLAPGTVSFLGTLHSAAFLAGISIGNSFPDDVDEGDERIITGVSLAAADVALALGIAYIDRIDIGRNRVFWLDTGGLIGWIGGAGLGAVIAGDDPRAAAIGSTLGMAAGIALTWWSTGDTEAWRRRQETKPAGGLSLDPPSLRIEPDRHRGGTRLGLDVLRGRF